MLLYDLSQTATTATNRAMIAIMENNQQEDGSVEIPKFSGNTLASKK
ncbi:MAG: hypothetical protein ACXAEU_13050 [Candidatus Hodarchaeales archaeon]|jgi:seryl-tRNA synthetase